MIGLFSAPLGFVVALGRRCSCWTARSRPTAIPYFIHWSLDGAVARLHHRHLGGHRHRLRRRPGAAGDAHQPAGEPQGGRPRLDRRAARMDAERAGGRAGRDVALMLLIGASLFVRSFLNLQKATRRVRHRAADDAALLPARRRSTSRTTPRPDASKTSSGASRRCRVCRQAFASNFVPLGGGGGGGDVIVEGKPVEPGQGAGDRLHCRDAAPAPDARRRAGARPRPHRQRGDHADPGRADQPDDGQASCGAMPIRSAAVSGSKAIALPTGSPWSASSPTSATTRATSDDAIVPAAVRAVSVRSDAEHRPDHPGRRGDPARDQRGGARADPPVRRARCRCSRSATMEDLRQRSFWQFRLFGVDVLACSARSRCCSRRSASTACSRTRSRSARRRSASGWRSARRAATCCG